ncbi:MAG: TAT-variant-translocated molybdopterin oxidoreductase [Bacteroidia bacterium]
MEKKYWRSLEEFNNTDSFVQESSKEFAQELPLEDVFSGKSDLASNRRDFLKYCGFGLSAAALAACNKTPVKKAIPFVMHPEEISPSLPNWYATSYFDGLDYASILVKCREGRPIKIEGNNLSSINQGGINARVQASVLGLYDEERLREPSMDGREVSWEDWMGELVQELSAAAPGTVLLLTPSVVSPLTRSLLQQTLTRFPSLRHVVMDSVSVSSLLEANLKHFGQAALPAMRFDQARVVVGIGADFLGNWISPVEFTKQWSTRRRPTKENPQMSRHIQFETLLSLTGSNADARYTYRASQEALVVANLYNAVAGLAGKSPLQVPSFECAGNAIAQTAKELWASRGSSLVVCGSGLTHVQILVNGINEMLGNYGKTLDWSTPWQAFQGIDSAVDKALQDLKSGLYKAVFVQSVNPVYHSAQGTEWAKALKAVRCYGFGLRRNETLALCRGLAPSHHILETWGDAEPRRGLFSLVQPAIAPLYNTKSWDELLLGILGRQDKIYDVLRNSWITRGAASGVASDFSAFWRKVLHDGIYEKPQGGASLASLPMDFNAACASLKAGGFLEVQAKGLELVTYTKLGIGDGRLAHIPWLQELPDPITKACWDNYLMVSMVTAQSQGLKDGDLVRIQAGGVEQEVPVLVQPGLFADTMAIALGYGQQHAGKAGTGVGVQASPWHRSSGFLAIEAIEKTGETYAIAQTQTHHTIEGRLHVKETTLAEYAANPASGNVRPYVSVRQEDGSTKKVYPGISRDAITLWQKRDYEGHHWAMAIDLNACTGCGSCVVSCQVENNVPVVGKQEVLNRREMHWIRIDRYYNFDNQGESNQVRRINTEDEYAGINKPDQVSVLFQPIMCHQCDNAPCETVCPVLATVHSSEGLNQMVYNRCVGTRYCANNCPYKVRRFNWFYYIDNPQFYNNPAQTDLGRMVLNPDVTVRARGVMEKCTFCVQRIQAGKLDGKRKGMRPVDGSIQTACQQSCPAGAIVFGDLNDPQSEVSRLFLNERTYGVVEELNVLPSVNFLTKVRNTTPLQA